MAHKNYISKILKMTPLALIALVMGALYLWGGFEWLNFEVLRERHMELKLAAKVHPLLAALGFMLIYALLVALSLPGGALLSVLGGFLFPQPLSLILVVIGATMGASGLFGAAKTAFGKMLKKKAGSRLTKLRRGFAKNAASYMLFLRLVPLFPFWLVNLAPALLGVRFFTFFWTTAIGIIPGSFVYTQAGRGLSAIFEQKNLTLSSLLNPHIQIALSALGLFAILPIVIQWVKKRRKKR